MADPKETTMLVIGMIFLFIFAVWLFYPSPSVKTSVETLVPTLSLPTMTVEPGKNTPQLNPTTGSIMDGPGFESGPTDIPQSQTYDHIPANYYFLDDGAGGSDTVINNLCSKSCCSDSDWPTPFKQKYDPYVCGNKDKFVPSNYMCNNAFQDSGCLCMTKKQNDFLANRGNNGFPWV